MVYPQLSNSQKQLLDLALARILLITKDIHMVFLLSPEERFTSSRHTYPFFPDLELLVILSTDTMADFFYERWMVSMISKREKCKGTLSRVNLQIISEREFVDELDSLEEFKERVLRSRIVYDREAHLYN